MAKKQKYELVNFRADEATLEAIAKLTAADLKEKTAPGEIPVESKSRAIRKGLIYAASMLGK